MTELICIVCPKGCHLKVDEENGFSVSGHTCQKGETYGKKELTNPTRVVTSTVCINGAIQSRLPVKTNRDIPKGEITNAMKLLNSITMQGPVKIGDVVISNLLGLDVDFVATKTINQSNS